MSLFSSAKELEQRELEVLKAHQKARRDHEAAKTRVTAAAESLARAEDDHAEAYTARVEAKQGLSDALKDA